MSKTKRVKKTKFLSYVEQHAVLNMAREGLTTLEIAEAVKMEEGQINDFLSAIDQKKQANQLEEQKEARKDKNEMGRRPITSPARDIKGAVKSTKAGFVNEGEGGRKGLVVMTKAGSEVGDESYKGGGPGKKMSGAIFKINEG